MLLQVGFDRGLEFSDAAEDTAADGVVGDQAEEAFAQVDPGGRCRGEVEAEARVALEPSPDLGVLVGGVVVDDQIQIEPFGACCGRWCARTAGIPDGDAGACIRR